MCLWARSSETVVSAPFLTGFDTTFNNTLKRNDLCISRKTTAKLGVVLVVWAECGCVANSDWIHMSRLHSLPSPSILEAPFQVVTMLEKEKMPPPPPLNSWEVWPNHTTIHYRTSGGDISLICAPLWTTFLTNSVLSWSPNATIKKCRSTFLTLVPGLVRRRTPL